MSVEPTGKVIDEKEAAKIAKEKADADARKEEKLKENAEKAKKMKEEAEMAEFKAQEAKEAELKRQTLARMSAYDNNMKMQADEAKRVANIRARPVDIPDPLNGLDKSENTAGEHWTANMPDHILDNKVGPTADPMKVL